MSTAYLFNRERVIDYPKPDDGKLFEWEAFRGRTGIKKIVLGQLGDDAAKKPLTLPPFPADTDFGTLFPDLTHLYIWNCTGLGEALPRLPDGLECLDVRGWKDLTSIDNLPEKGLETLVIWECEALRDLPVDAGHLEFHVLDDVSFRGCAKLSEACLNRLLTSAPNLTKFEASGLENVRCLGVERAQGPVELSWPKGIVDLRLDKCLALRTLPRAWPPSLRRLGLSGSKAVVSIPAFPPSADYLDLAGTKALRKLPEIQGRPRTLFLHGSGVDLSPELLGESATTNVAREVLADRDQAGEGRMEDHEIKVILLGNGRCGKSSLARRWVEGTFDEKESSTHGIRHWIKSTTFIPIDDPEGRSANARLNIWDFAGQDLYHNTHRLFLQSRAIFVLCWTDHGDGADARGDVEERELMEDEGVEDVRRTLRYWREQIAALGPMPGLNRPPPIILVRTKQDRDQEAREAGSPYELDGEAEDSVAFSAKTGDGLAELESRLETLVSEMLGGWERRSLPKAALQVKDALRLKLDANDAAFRANERDGRIGRSPHPTIEREAFDELVRVHCTSGDYHDDPGLLLQRFHQTGVLFYDQEHLPDTVILDQRWAVEGIYAFSNRDSRWSIRERLFRWHGEFTLTELDRYSWRRAGFTPSEQALLLRFMLSCGMCFELMSKDETQRGESVYVAMGFLPLRESLLRRRPEIEDGPKSAWQSVSLPGVSEPEMQALIGWVGTRWRRIAELWRWGLMVRAEESGARLVIDWQRGGNDAYTGDLKLWFDGPEDRRFEAFAQKAIMEALSSGEEGRGRRLEKAWAPTVVPPDLGRAAHVFDDTEMPASRPAKGEDLAGSRFFPSKSDSLGLTVTFSYAGSDNGETLGVGALPRALARALKARFGNDGKVRVLDYALEVEEERINQFTRNLARGDLTLVFWSKKYFYSKYCMTEMKLIYDRPPAGRLLAKRVLIYQIDGARLSDGGAVKAKEWDKHWDALANQRKKEAEDEFPDDGRRQKKLLERDGVFGQWFDFVLSEHEFETFLRVLKSYRIGRLIDLSRGAGELETQVASLLTEIEELLQNQVALLDLAMQRLQDGNKVQAVELLLHVFANDPDGSDESLAARLKSKSSGAIPDELLEAAREVLKLNEPDAE